MVKKKLDNRIRVLIENGVKLGHRTMFVIVGEKARHQVPILYDILNKSAVKARPPVLWCYKTKDEALSQHGKKRAKKIAAGKVDVDEGDLFDAFLAATTIHARYYSETHAILGRTYGVCVLQDFEALTPNLLARTVETVEGGGLIILLLTTIQSLRQVYTMSMDVHKRFRTESHQTVTCRFNERLFLSLADCKRCLVVNDDLTVLPLSSKTINVEPVNPSDIQKRERSADFQALQEGLMGVSPAQELVALCKTYDQANAVAQFVDALVDKQLKPPMSLTAARGRGKSAAMGLAIAAAVAFKYVNIYVTSPHPENLITLFEFVLKGFDALDYTEHTDYTTIRSTNPDFKKAIVRIEIHRGSRQTIQYIGPSDTHLLNAADLLMIDEAAAIPLPLVKRMIGPYLIFMSSTINGYEGTGRSLSLKLFAQLQREKNARQPLQLEESIRYRSGDDIESWLIGLLCLDTGTLKTFSGGCPTPDSCNMFYVNRDALFSYKKPAEAFLHRMVSILVASHYKNTPNDLQMMSDAPAHHLFCLLGPTTRLDQMPEILVVIQVALEGKIVSDTFGRGIKAAGDLIPWNIAEQFGDKDFLKLSGVRIVRIATHPNYMRMGYGKRALRLLKDYYGARHINDDVQPMQRPQAQTSAIEEVDENEVGVLTEMVRPSSDSKAVLLQRLEEREPEKVDYIGTSYGLTSDLLKFWKGGAFVPVYLSQKSNELTAEHSCVMLHSLEAQIPNWLVLYNQDFRRRVLKLMAKSFREFPTKLCLALIKNKTVDKVQDQGTVPKLDKQILDAYFLPHDLQRLDSYARQQCEFRLIADLMADIAYLYFQNRIDNIQLDGIQQSILLGMGIQGKSVDDMGQELDMPGGQILSKFFDVMKKCNHSIHGVIEQHLSQGMPTESELPRGEEMISLGITADAELTKSAKKLIKDQRKKLAALRLGSNEENETSVESTSKDLNKDTHKKKKDHSGLNSSETSVESTSKDLNKDTRKKKKEHLRHDSNQENETSMTSVENDRNEGAPKKKKKRNHLSGGETK